MTTAQAVVDSHIHFWDTDRFDYPWLQCFTELNRPFVPSDLDVGDVLFALQPQFVDAVQLAGQFGLTVDLCVRNHQIAEVTKLAELCPEGDIRAQPLRQAGRRSWPMNRLAPRHQSHGTPGQRPLQAVRAHHRGRRRHSRHEQVMRRASGDALGYAFSSGLEAALTKGPHQ